MSDVKWIKLTVDMFDNRKIKYLRKLPDGNSIVLIWVMLLTMAGRCNAGGMIYLTENVPYTTKTLADELDFEENTVKLALEALERLNMIHFDTALIIDGWEEYQNIDKLAEIREYNRIAKQRSRERQKALPHVNDMSMTSQRCHDTEEELELDLEREPKNKESAKRGYDRILSEFAIGDDVKAAIIEFIKMRKAIKKPLTDRALKMLVNKLRELASDEETQIAILNQSIFHSWQGIFPLRDERNNAVGANGVKLATETDHTLDGIL